MKRRFHLVVLICWFTTPYAWGGPPFFYKVCGSFLELREIAGPQLHTDPKAIDLAVKKIPVLKGRLETEFRDSVKVNGLYGSTPFVEEDLKAGAKLEAICTVVATGGVSFVVKEAIKASEKLLNSQDRIDSIARAVTEADEECMYQVNKTPETK